MTKGMTTTKKFCKRSRRKHRLFLQNSGEENIHKQDPKEEVIK